MKVLIVSGQQFSRSNRSMDTITEYFLETKNQVDHLCFGINKLKKMEIKFKEEQIKNFNQLYSKKSYFSYLGVMGKFFPDFALNFIKNKTIKTINFIDFSKYNLIVLETGKPLFLLDIIPKNIPIICRQSDPLEISIQSDREYFKKIEKNALERSIFSLIAHKKAVEEYTMLNNLLEWKSGFEVKNLKKSCKPNNEKKILSYMGMFKLDFDLIKELATSDLNIEIHIIGNYKDCLNLSNVIFEGYLDYKNYIEILEKTDCFIVPYHRKEVRKMKKLGLTSKYYLPMSMGIPILTRSYGEVDNDIIKYNVYVYKEIEEAKIKLNFILKNKFEKNEEIEIFLKNLEMENRKKELENILKEYKII